jgi:hypothetical protein
VSGGGGGRLPVSAVAIVEWSAARLSLQAVHAGVNKAVRRYYEHLCDWSEPGAVKVNRGSRLLEPSSPLDQGKLVEADAIGDGSGG